MLKLLGNNISHCVKSSIYCSKTGRWTNWTFQSIQKERDKVKMKNIVSKRMYSYVFIPKDVPLSCKVLFLGCIFSSYMCTLIKDVPEVLHMQGTLLCSAEQLPLLLKQTPVHACKFVVSIYNLGLSQRTSASNV